MHKDFSDDAWADYTLLDYKNRLVYKIEDGLIKIIQCKNHYDDK